MRIVKPLSDIVKDDLNTKFLVFDTETWGLDARPEKLAFGVIYGFNFIKILFTPEEFKNEFKKDFYKGKKIFAHNAEYDLSTIFGNVIEDVDNSAIFNGKFIAANYGKTMFCDSANLFPASVDKIGVTLGMGKGTTPEKFINGENEKGIDIKDVEYCIRDCEIIYNALLNLFQKVGGMRITIASTAMYYFRKRFLKKPLIYNDLNDLFFESYYGGRTEAFKIGKTDSVVYDINSLYPDRMLNITFPDIKNLKRYDNVSIQQFKYLLSTKEGFAKVRIKHDSIYFGLLPVKTKINGSTKLLFPVGTFETTVNFNELRYAINTGYVSVLSVDYCVCSSPIESPFKSYVETLYNERKNESNELSKTILKLLLNSLYGKFGMREKYETTYYKKIPHSKITKLKEEQKFYELKLFSHERNDCYLVTENLKTKKSFFSIPTLASYITSAARIKLLDGLLKNENNTVVYCDTDSIFLESTKNLSIPISNELGDWKLEDKKVIEIRGLKNYTYIEEGKQKDAIKGVSKRSEELERYTFKSVKVTKTKEAIRRNIETGKPQEQIKIITNKYDKRIVNIDGTTKPIELLTVPCGTQN